MFCHRSVSRLLITVMIVALTLGGLSSRALATQVQSTSVKINGGVADFGSGNHSFGSPESSGAVTFMDGATTLAAGVVLGRRDHCYAFH